MQTLGRRIVVAAFDGWNDAGEAATGAVRMLREEGDLSPAFAVDPELYFDYQYTRPHIEADGEGGRTLRWPDATLHRPSAGIGDVWFWTITGNEPARAWRSFAGEFVDRALAEDITGLVTLGSMMSDVPHTRPISVFASSENAAVREQLGLERSTYEGPVGILSVLGDAAERAGIPTLSLWASVPHYVAGHTPSPKATLALLEKLEELTGAVVPKGTLATDAATWEATIDAAAADDEDMSDYIRQLEQTRDTVDSPDASGDAIAQAFERYLHRDDPRDGRDGRGDRR
ncbi:PAC2 family protein [Microbacterium sp. NPDC055683]